MDSNCALELRFDKCMNAVRINEKQFYIFGGWWKGSDSMLLEVSEEESKKMVMRGRNQVVLNETQF